MHIGGISFSKRTSQHHLQFFRVSTGESRNMSQQKVRDGFFWAKERAAGLKAFWSYAFQSDYRGQYS